MLNRNHSSLALPIALSISAPFILPVALASHLLLDKFAGNVVVEKDDLRIEILLHLLYLTMGLYCGVLLPVIFSIVCLNLPDILRRFPKIELHNIYKFSNRLSLSVEGQGWVDLFGLLISAGAFIAFVVAHM